MYEPWPKVYVVKLGVKAAWLQKSHTLREFELGKFKTVQYRILFNIHVLYPQNVQISIFKQLLWVENFLNWLTDPIIPSSVIATRKRSFVWLRKKHHFCQYFMKHVATNMYQYSSTILVTILFHLLCSINIVIYHLLCIIIINRISKKKNFFNYPIQTSSMLWG